MVRVRIEQTIDCRPDDVLDMVMDIKRYAEVDKKINPVIWSLREGDVLRFACKPKLAGLRQPKVTQYARLTPGQRIDIGLTPLPSNRLAHALGRFQASFECTEINGRTRVVRILEFQFTPVLRWLLEPLFAHWLEGEVREELRLAKNHLEHPAPWKGPSTAGSR